MWILSITSKSSFEVSGKGRCTSSFFRAKQTANFLPGFSLVSLFFSFSLLVLTLLMLECICTHNKQTFSTLYTQWRRRLHYSFSGSHSFKETSIMTPIFWQPWLERKGSFWWRKKNPKEPYIFFSNMTVTPLLSRWRSSRRRQVPCATTIMAPFFASGKKCILV